MLKKKYFVMMAVFLFCFSLVAQEPTVVGAVALEKNPNIISLPQNLNHVPEILISRDEYLISYNSKRREPNWVAWKLTAFDLGHVGRQPFFNVDPDISKVVSNPVDSQEYKGSCFDRGHQIPSADRDSTPQKNAMTFLMSNVVPQTANLNRGIWEHLESYTRLKIKNGEKIAYVIAGTIFDEDFGFIGPKKDIPVPSKNYKIVVFFKNGETPVITANTEMIVVNMPNILSTGKKPLNDFEELCSEASEKETQDFSNIPSDDWKNYQTTLEEVQNESGFHFF